MTEPPRSLSFDLHLHPGSDVSGRWGDGPILARSAAAFGVRGFVWKSHDHHTAAQAVALSSSCGLQVIGSASCNEWASPTSVAQAVSRGARWVWGPTRDASGRHWDLPLPSWWASAVDSLDALDLCLVLATGHVGEAGRETMATAAASRRWLCSVTHSAYITPAERMRLLALGCHFEFDLYTAWYPQPGRPSVDLPKAIAATAAMGAMVYLTSDAGQAHVGDPFAFTSRCLDTLHSLIDDELAELATQTNPQCLVEAVSAR